MKITDLQKRITEHSEEHVDDRMVQKHIDFFGMPVCVEIVAGGVKYSTTRDGEPWQKTLKCDYGYFDGITGGDGEFLDCYIGPNVNEPSCNVYVVNQMSPDGSQFDEHKVMIGFADIKEAKRVYLEHCHTNKCFGGIKQLRIDDFRAILNKIANN
jgi:hypothetical protein